MPPAPAPPRALPRLRLALRAAGIAFLIAQHALRWLLGWLWLLLVRAPREQRRRWFGQVVLDLVRTLGATFVKVGQIMSTRPDLFPEHITRTLAKLQDDVGPFPFEAVVRTLEEDLGRPLPALFAEFAPVPLASASVAQVHRARLHDGRLVAVKVRRPEVVELCRFDLTVVAFVARQIGRIPSLGALDPAAAVEQFGRAIFAQLDFRVEAANNRRFRANFAGVPEVLFPELVDALCTERVLCMSFIDGRKILTPAGPGDDPKRIARLGLQALLKMIFEDGFVHADLHPGNILITHDGKLALLDLGLVGELDDPHRKAFTRFFAAWARRDGDAVAKLMSSLSASPLDDAGAYERYRADIAGFVERHWGQRLAEVQMGKVLLEMLALLRKHRVRVSPTFTMVNIAIAVTEGIGKQLDPGLDLMAEAVPYFAAHPLRPDA